MSNILAEQVFGGGKKEVDVFSNEVALNEELLKEYHMRNERKKQDDKWLKDNKPAIMKGLEALGKTKADIGEYRASYSVPNKSHFDMEKVIEFLDTHCPTDVSESIIETQRVVNEGVLSEYIEREEVDLEALKEYAWVEKYDSPRLTISTVKK